MSSEDRPENEQSLIMGVVRSYWPVVIVGVFLLGLGLAFSWQSLLEMGLYLALLLIVGRHKGVASTWETLPRPYRIFLVTLVTVLLGAQLLGRSTLTFPFVGWSMYSFPPAAHKQHFSYTAMLQSGQAVPLKVSDQFPSLRIRLKYYLHGTANQIMRYSDELTHQTLITRYEDTLRAVMRQYNRRHPDAPARAIHVARCTMPLLKDYHSEDSIECRPFWQVPLHSEEGHRAS